MTPPYTDHPSADLRRPLRTHRSALVSRRQTASLPRRARVDR
jgi:hypothetical protein